MELKILSVIDEMSDDAVGEIEGVLPVQEGDIVLGEVPMYIRKMIRFTRDNTDPLAIYLREMREHFDTFRTNPQSFNIGEVRTKAREAIGRGERQSKIAEAVTELIVLEIEALFQAVPNKSFDIRKDWTLVLFDPAQHEPPDLASVEEEAMQMSNCGDPNCLVHGHLNQRSRVDLFDI